MRFLRSIFYFIGRFFLWNKKALCIAICKGRITAVPPLFCRTSIKRQSHLSCNGNTRSPLLSDLHNCKNQVQGPGSKATFGRPFPKQSLSQLTALSGGRLPAYSSFSQPFSVSFLLPPQTAINNIVGLTEIVKQRTGDREKFLWDVQGKNFLVPLKVTEKDVRGKIFLFHLKSPKIFPRT